MRADPILDRIDAALEKTALREMKVRAIYLTAEDQDAFDRAMSRRFKVKGSFLAYGDHQIRRGATSTIYSTHGVSVNIPRKLSSRTKAAA